MPELDKIVRMSEIFHVSTDYLLRQDAPNLEIEAAKNLLKADEISLQSNLQNTAKKAEHEVSADEADSFMESARATASKLAFGIVLLAAIYVAVSFRTEAWHITWIIFAAGGIFYAACIGIIHLLYQKKFEKI